MYSVESDRSKRLLVISAAGRVTKKEVESVALRVREMMKEATPGFRVLTDFRWLERMDPGGSGPSCGNHGCAGGERCRGRGPGRSRSRQGHWLKYSFAISLRPANQVSYLRVVSGSAVSVDGQRNPVSAVLPRRPTIVATVAGAVADFRCPRIQMICDS